MAKLKILFFLFLLFIAFSLVAQNKFHSIYIKGKITKDDIALPDVKINILVNNVKEKTINNEKNGEYNFTLEPAKEYIVEYTKKGFVTKRIFISAKEVTEAEIKYGMFPLSVDIQLFEDFEGLNSEVLKKPVAKWTFTDYEGDFVNDVPYSLLMKDEADKVKSKMLVLKKQAYDKLIYSADNSFKNKELEDSWLDYDNSLNILPNEIYPKNQIKEIKRLINEKMSIEEAFKRSIERGDKHFNIKNYKNALSFYKKSLLYKPFEKYPQDRIVEIEKILTGNNEFVQKVENNDNSDDLFSTKNNNVLNENNSNNNLLTTQLNNGNNNNLQTVVTNNNQNTNQNKTNNLTVNIISDSLVKADRAIAINKLNENVTNLVKSGNKEELAKTYYNLAIQYLNSNEFDRALDYYNYTYKINEQLGLKQINASLGEEIADFYKNIFRYSKAIEFYNKSYSIYTELDDNKSALEVMKKIGDVSYISGDYIKAIDYYKKSTENKNENGTKSDISGRLNSIGISYFQAGNYEEAIKYFQQSINSADEYGNNMEKAMSLNNIGNVKYEYSNFDDAINYYSQSIKIKKDIDYKKGMAISLHNIGNVYNKLKQFDNSLNYFKQSFNLAKEIDNKELMCENYYSFSEVYSILKDCNKALENYKLYATNKQFISRDLSHDQLVEASFSSNTISELNKEFVLLKSEMQRQQILSMYESEKNSKEIAFMNQQAKIHRLELIKKEEKLRNQQILIAISFIGLIVVIFLASMYYRQYKDKKYAYVKLEEQNEEICIQKEEIEAQRDLVIVQKEKLETIHSELTSSIRYAQRIQTAVLPTEEQISKLLDNYFVLFKPRDIVSGDFYWLTKVTVNDSSLLIIAVADCTGHGVPGAFMSILGISLMDEIVRKEHITTPNLILNKLRESIISSLQQKNTSENKQLSDNVYDGMDLAICTINLDSYELQFAGANSPLYIVRQNNSENILTFEELKGDKMPVGMYTVMKQFNNKEIKIEKGDSIYLFSDGFADQFGGSKGRKFLHSQLKGVLLNIANLQMNEQKIILEETYNKWTGNLSQVDDILIFGIKV